ncbi:hypothetical protein [Pedobacter frigidisoli]|uniref:hypothetical protein n=1 Tax=Pedobacter frigidisoli TaxID=2530455 RepID=UPI0013F148AC|nr:hypothetical protein [Pedobacter frigidisoli]
MSELISIQVGDHIKYFNKGAEVDSIRIITVGISSVFRFGLIDGNYIIIVR